MSRCDGTIDTCRPSDRVRSDHLPGRIWRASTRAACEFISLVRTQTRGISGSAPVTDRQDAITCAARTSCDLPRRQGSGRCCLEHSDAFDDFASGILIPRPGSMFDGHRFTTRFHQITPSAVVRLLHRLRKDRGSSLPYVSIVRLGRGSDRRQGDSG